MGQNFLDRGKWGFPNRDLVKAGCGTIPLNRKGGTHVKRVTNHPLPKKRWQPLGAIIKVLFPLNPIPKLAGYSHFHHI